eukprot:1004305-Pleurochrysis_carterae.AAC.1
MHVNDFDGDYLPLARIDDDMLPCLHTTAAIASDLLPPPKNYKQGDSGCYKTSSESKTTA